MAWVCFVLALLNFQGIKAGMGAGGLAVQWALCGGAGGLGSPGTVLPPPEGQPAGAAVERFGEVRLFAYFTPSRR